MLICRSGLMRATFVAVAQPLACSVARGNNFRSNGIREYLINALQARNKVKTTILALALVGLLLAASPAFSHGNRGEFGGLVDFGGFGFGFDGGHRGFGGFGGFGGD